MTSLYTSAKQTSLEQRLAELEDKEAIRGMMMRGWRALDHKDWQGWIDCWAEDAEFFFGPWDVTRGRDAIYDKVVAAEAPLAAMQHHILNMQVQVDGDEASGTGYMWFVAINDAERPDRLYEMGGPYVWRFVRTPAGWKVARQHLDVTWTKGADATGAFESEG